MWLNLGRAPAEKSKKREHIFSTISRHTFGGVFGRRCKPRKWFATRHQQNCTRQYSRAQNVCCWTCEISWHLLCQLKALIFFLIKMLQSVKKQTSDCSRRIKRLHNRVIAQNEAIGLLSCNQKVYDLVHTTSVKKSTAQHIKKAAAKYSVHLKRVLSAKMCPQSPFTATIINCDMIHSRLATTAKDGFADNQILVKRVFFCIAAVDWKGFKSVVSSSDSLRRYRNVKTNIFLNV